MRLSILAAMLLISSTAVAQERAGPPPFRVERIEAPSQAGAIPLWPEGALPKTDVVERWGKTIGDLGPVHIEQSFVRNVTRPTITPVLPDPTKATGAAVIVAPGGAFLSLSMDNEGFNVAQWLADHGIVAFVLKYRLNETPDDDAAYMARVAEVFAGAGAGDISRKVEEPRAAEDALQALKLIRADATKFGVDPKRVGMIGFSAGAMTTLQAVLKAQGAAGPDFIGYIYGPMHAIEVPANAPPMFAALALDDGLFGRQGFGIVDAWHKAGRPVELHAYERGDHGFGMGRPGTTTTLLMDEFHAWLASRGLLGASGAR